MLVTHIITGLSRGGAESALYRLIQAQPDPSRHSVISLMDEGIFGARLRALGVEVRCAGLRRGGIPSPVVIWKLSRWLWQIRPAVVQTWMYHADLLGGIAARLMGIPVCWGIRQSNLSSDQNKRLTLRVAQCNARLSKWLPSRIVSCSVRAVQVHRSLGYADRFVVIPNGLNLTCFKPMSPEHRICARHALNLPEEGKVIGHLGRSDPQKDHATLLRVFAQVAARYKDAYLLLAGADLEHSSSYLSNLLSQTGTSALVSRIRALGQRDDVPELMGSMDVFLLSSVGEAFPNVVVEAMACGTPCVVTDVGDSAEIVNDTGWVAVPGNVDQIAAAVFLALEEPEDTYTLRRKRARQRVEENYGIDHMVTRYQKVWDATQGNVGSEQ